MPRLSHSEIEGHMAEDTICQGCDRDQMDCVCTSLNDDADLYQAMDIDGPDFDMEPYDDSDTYPHEDLSYLDMAWWHESDRMPLDDDTYRV